MSSGEVLNDTDSMLFIQEIKELCNQGYTLYLRMLEKGVAREQARGILCIYQYTNFYATVDLHNLLWFLELRRHPHAQEEIRKYAFAIEEIIKEIVPYTYSVWNEMMIEKYK